MLGFAAACELQGAVPVPLDSLSSRHIGLSAHCFGSSSQPLHRPACQQEAAAAK